MIRRSKNTSLGVIERKNYLTKSIIEIEKLQRDTSRARLLSKTAYQTLKLGDSSLFEVRNKKALVFAKQIKDTFAIGDIHWSYATYFNKQLKFDSAYYHFSKANNFFEMGEYLFEAGKTQYGMAYIRGHFRDYPGSEILTFNAIKKFEEINDLKSLYTLYNYLAIMQNDIQQYDEALQYHETALSYLKDIDNSDNLEKSSFNNIGVTYSEMKNYDKALKYFEKILVDDRLKTDNPLSYARVIDNKAYSKFSKGDSINVLNKFFESFNIRDSLNDKGGKIISMLHLSEYYDSLNSRIKAFEYANGASQLAKEINNSRDYLKSLELLSKINPKSNQKYLKDYIKFNDSLLTIERQTQNKFTRIDYETDQYIEETERLSQLNIMILIVSIGSFIFLSLIYFINLQRKRNRNLYLESEQQKANEQVYILALNQKEKLEKEKNNERIRISEELHDGILGKLFGTRLNLSFLDLDLKESVKSKFDSFLLELQDIEKEIREVSHKLNTDFDDSKINFVSLIQQLLDQNSKIGNFKSELIQNNEIDWNNIDEITKVNLYKIIQESIFNIIKHSETNNVIIKFRFSNGHLYLSIIDNGIGFKQKRKPEGIGLKNIKSRIEKLDGSYEILSEKDEGTKILIQVPIK
jgi:signal transduction histidine kinase